MPDLKELMGRWKVVESENFDALFEKMGIPWLMRKMFGNAKPDMELEALESDADGQPVRIRQRIKTPMKTRELTFRIGEPFDEHSPNGKTLKSVMSLESRDPLKLVRRSVDGSEIQMTSSWELQSDGRTLISTIQMDEVVARRRYERKIKE